jgi:hypothetical protein
MQVLVFMLMLLQVSEMSCSYMNKKKKQMPDVVGWGQNSDTSQEHPDPGPGQ